MATALKKEPIHNLELGFPKSGIAVTDGVGAKAIPNPLPLAPWPEPQEPAYKYLFAVNVTDTDPMNLACKIYGRRAPVTKQGDLKKEHFDDAMAVGMQIKTAKLDLKLPSDKASLVILHLAEEGVTFEDPAHLDDVAYVILRNALEDQIIYQVQWLPETNDRKTISLIVRGHLPTDDPKNNPIHYALRVKSIAGEDISHTNVDPKVENEGDGN